MRQDRRYRRKRNEKTIRDGGRKRKRGKNGGTRPEWRQRRNERGRERRGRRQQKERKEEVKREKGGEREERAHQ